MKKTSNATKIHQCCTQAESCPNLNLKRHKRATVIDFDSELQRNFANRLCPVGWQACRYDQNQVDADPSIEDTCISLTELNEFAECQQGCEETFPKGQLISKCIFGIFNPPKNRTKKKFDFTTIVTQVELLPFTFWEN